MFANLSEYNENLRAQDAARAARRQQPQGLASYQAKKAAQEAARLAPYSVVNEKYGNYPWHVLKDGQELGYKGWFETKKAAIAWIEEQKEQEQKTTDDHSTQEQPAEQKEEKKMKKVEFAQDAIIVNGQEYAARYEYGETPRGHYLPTIRIFTALSGSACIVELPDDDSEYCNARAAMEKAQEQTETHAQEEQQEQTETTDDHSEQAQELQEQPAEQTDETPAPTAQELQEEQEEQPETPAQDAEQEQTDETTDDHSEQAQELQEQPAEQTDETPAPTAQEPQEEQPAPDPKQARGPVPEKTFIGTSISGHGYSIVFDGGCNRTRVIVTDDAKEKARPIIEKAGFYYSAALDSWNKKLTFRAYRAAQALAAELEKALAA